MLQGPPLSETDRVDLALVFQSEREQRYWILSPELDVGHLAGRSRRCTSTRSLRDPQCGGPG